MTKGFLCLRFQLPLASYSTVTFPISSRLVCSLTLFWTWDLQKVVDISKSRILNNVGSVLNQSKRSNLGERHILRNKKYSFLLNTSMFIVSNCE